MAAANAPPRADALKTSIFETLARSLKPEQYEALWLRYSEGLSISDIARVRQCNSLAVRVLLHRARAALAKKLKRAKTDEV